MAVANVMTGEVYRNMPYGTLDVQKGGGQHFEGAAFRPGSRLLILEGCFDVEASSQSGKPLNCSRSFYTWEAPRFRLIKRIPYRMPAFYNYFYGKQ
jgi:hypothetical protein